MSYKTTSNILLTFLAFLLAFFIISSCDDDIAAPSPVTDVIPVVMDENATDTFCVDDVYDLNGLDSAVIISDGGLEVVVDDNSLCVTITNDYDGSIIDTVCVAHCEGPLCDTTYIVVASCEICSGEDHDCNDYFPTPSSGDVSDQWDAPNDEDVFTGLVVTPSDPGGGIWTVTVSTGDPVIPYLYIGDLGQGGAITSGTAIGTSNEQQRKCSFLGYPNISYSVIARSGYNAPSSEYPWDYNVSWSFQSRVDCYEPNDFMEDAKAVPTNEDLEAYALGGLIDNYLSTGADQTYDWYKFELDATTPNLRIDLTQSPQDARLTMTLLYANGVVAPMSFNIVDPGGVNQTGRTFYMENTRELEPGTYYLQQHHDYSRAVVNHDTPIPDNWNTKYKFRISPSE